MSDANYKSVQDTVVEATAPGIEKPKASAQSIKQRLDWGEPGFTLLDARDRDSFNASRIMGAMPYPLDDPQTAQFTQSSLDPRREIYVYGDTDEQAASAANQLREAGYTEVSEMQGGLAAWQAIGGPVEGTGRVGEKVVPQGAYNVGDRLKENEQVQRKFE